MIGFARLPQFHLPIEFIYGIIFSVIKMKKTILIILGSLLALVLVAAIVLVANTFMYYPHYKEHKEAVNIEPKEDNIKMMSYNLRCISPTDWGKKGWFYRADLIIDVIADEKPGIIGFQEATKWHYSYLVDSLKGYDSVLHIVTMLLILRVAPYSIIQSFTPWLIKAHSGFLKRPMFPVNHGAHSITECVVMLY